MTRRTKSSAGSAVRFHLPGSGFRTWLFPILALTAASVLVYANAWHEGLVFDDKLFGNFEQFADLTEVPRYFVTHVWAQRITESGLYRPMLFLSVSLDAILFTDWFTGYHAVNVLYHAFVTILLFVFLRTLLSIDGHTRAEATTAAFLAALVFGIHPVHTEVVNSIFNRSVLLAAIGTLTGLWCLMRFRDSKPVLAWCGIAFAYLFALFSRETAIVLPALAAVIVFLYAPGDRTQRIRECRPVLFLLLPLLLYVAMRGNALTGGELGAFDGIEPEGMLDEVGASFMPRPERLPDVAGNLALALRVYLWPFEPRLHYPQLTDFWQWVGVSIHAGLLAAALLLYRRGYRGFLAGLMIFYLASLPASRLFGAASFNPHLQERYLYLPSIGLALIMTYAFAFLRRRFDPILAAAPVVLFVLVMAPVTWVRNADWSDEIVLFERDYEKGSRSEFVLRLLTGAHLREANFQRILQICDANRDLVLSEMARVSVHCASAYSYTGRSADAEQAYLAGTRHERVSGLAYSNLAQHYMRQGRRDEAKVQFENAIDAEQNPARKAYRRGYMLVHLYPDQPEKLAEAREHFSDASRLEPRWRDPRKWLNRLDAVLGSRNTASKR